jgi:hypothetical protein
MNMPRSEKKCEILNDLLLINRDCSLSYQRLIESSRYHPVIDPILKQLLNVGRNCLLELRRQVDTTFGDPADAVESKGEIYRTWLQRTQHNSPLMESDIYAYCERRLKELNNAYSRAIQFGSEFSEQVLNMLNMHMEMLRDSFATVRRFTRENRVAPEMAHA